MPILLDDSTTATNFTTPTTLTIPAILTVPKFPTYFNRSDNLRTFEPLEQFAAGHPFLHLLTDEARDAQDMVP